VIVCYISSRSSLHCPHLVYISFAAQKSKLHNLQYDEGGNHMAETEGKLKFE
jgi:hypothetical protein